MEQMEQDMFRSRREGKVNGRYWKGGKESSICSRETCNEQHVASIKELPKETFLQGENILHAGQAQSDSGWTEGAGNCCCQRMRCLLWVRLQAAAGSPERNGKRPWKKWTETCWCRSACALMRGSVSACEAAWFQGWPLDCQNLKIWS